MKTNAIDGVRKGLFWLLLVLCLAPLLSLPPTLISILNPAALISGAILALAFGNPYLKKGRIASKWLLQASVVLLGFSMNLGTILATGRDGILFSLCSITAVFTLGWLLQRWMKIRPVTGLLISAGTAICGGSAIAAMSAVVEAPEEDITVAVGTIFMLNGVALLLFPILGHVLGLSQQSFGVWAGIAIHDIASVVGAGDSYGHRALDVATAVKLSRVLYLVPITFAAAFVHHKNNRRVQDGEKRALQVPWFVGLFLLASAARSYIPAVAATSTVVQHIATAGFAVTLFLIGGAITRETLKAVGIKPMLMGIALWLFISSAALAAVKFG